MNDFSTVAADPEPSWEALREAMPAAERWAYFDHAAVAPLSGPARNALDEWAGDMAANGGTTWSIWSDRIEQVRRLAADWIGAQTDELALVRNTTEGISLVAEGFPWRAGDNLITLADEFPSNLYPWLNLRRRGVEVRCVPTDRGLVMPGTVEAACDGRTRLISLSWVNFAHGYRQDLDAWVELCRSRGLALLVDAIQGLGVFPLDVSTTEIDFLAADGHKWLLGPEGAGVLYVRRPWLAQLDPLGVGWNSVVHAGDYSNPQMTLKTSAARYEGGSYNVGGIVALGASLELLGRFGTRRLSQRVLEIAGEAVTRLERMGARLESRCEDPFRSGIVAFDLPGKNLRLIRKAALAEGVALSLRGGRLRISPHAYNNRDDLERLVEVLSRAAL